MSDALKLENQLCHRFYLISNALTRAYRPLLEKLDITYPQYLVMMALWEKDKITIAALTQKTGIDAGAMTLILKKLSQKKLIKIEKDEEDKRVKHVNLTIAGQDLKKSAETIPAQMFCKFNHLNDIEVKQLVNLLDKMTKCFDD